MSPTTIPGKMTLAKEFTVQDYMWSFPQQYGLWSPAEITTALWLDAADASTVTTVSNAVSEWRDKSGNARHATQSTAGERPTYTSAGQNGLNVLTFDGSNDWLLLPNAAAPLGVNATFAAGKPNHTAASCCFVSREYYINGWAIDSRDSGTAARYTFNANATTSATLTNNTNKILTGIYNGSIVSISVNGGTATTTNNSTAPSHDARDLTVVGARFNNGGLPLASLYRGPMYEIIVLHSVPSTDTRQRIEGYLAHKWGLTANLPAGHPYKLVVPTP